MSAAGIVPLPKCPVCGRSIVGLVRCSNGDRQVVHFRRVDPDRCTVTTEAYADLAEWFADMNAKGAKQARFELALAKRSMAPSCDYCNDTRYITDGVGEIHRCHNCD